MYVPEVHPITKCPFHEREDEAHVFKVCYKSITYINYYALTISAYCSKPQTWRAEGVTLGEIYGGSVQ